jgi:hypothetical protein
MNSTAGTSRFNKGMDILVWAAGLAVLTANVLLLQQNRSLQELLAPQIAAGVEELTHSRLPLHYNWSSIGEISRSAGNGPRTNLQSGVNLQCPGSSRSCSFPRFRYSCGFLAVRLRKPQFPGL